jgi:hypothetical protein
VRLADRINRYLLVELLRAGQLLVSQKTSDLIEKLVTAGWVYWGGSRHVLIVEGKKTELVGFLDLHHKGWREEVARHNDDDQVLTEQVAKNSARLDGPVCLLPDVLYSQKTTAAVTLAHSKSRRTNSNDDSARDWFARIRPNSGLVLERNGEEVDAVQLSRIAGEIGVSERALNSGTRLIVSIPTYIVVCENSAAFIDMSHETDAMIILGGGNAWLSAAHIVGLYPEVPIVWFGDLDPEGVAIRHRFVRRTKRKVIAAIPPFWSEYLEGYAISAKGKWRGCNLDKEDDLVRQLAVRDQWLEQEPLALDLRLPVWIRTQIKRA